MKNFGILPVLLAIVFGLYSCGERTEKECYESTDQFVELVTNLNEQFTEKAGYQSIMISYDKILGNTILVKVAPDISKNAIEEWFYIDGDWEKKSEKRMEISKGQVSDFLFSIKKDYDLKKLGEIVSLSKEKIQKDVQSNKIMCKSVNLLMRNKRVSENKMDDLITQISIEKQDGSKVYNLNFDSSGKLKYQ